MGISKPITCILVLSWFTFCSAFPQEILVAAPPYNPETGLPLTLNGRLKAAVIDTIEIPFIDDFSRLTGIPDTALWADNMAFVNNSYSSDPVTIGVATLDAINVEGKLNGDSNVPFRSDYLTSKPINLDYPERNDIYLSFYYQPQGLGDNPEEADSLMLEFYAPGQYMWKKVWAVQGDSVSDFQQVFIQINDTAYLQPGFRFRFSNLASLPMKPYQPFYNTNVDHWNIDYVVLDTARSPGQTSIYDVAMVSNLPSFLKNYQAIPWTHFSTAFFTELRESLDISYSNHDNVVRNITRMLEIKDLYSGQTYSQSGGAINISPGETGRYPFPPDYPFDFYQADSVVFEIISYLITEAGDYRWNDTVKRNQYYTDYYAYDDGTAEFGYGLDSDGTENASVAYKFKSYSQDTLRGVRIHFNRYLDEETRYFSLAVWDHDDNLNQPGELIYSMSGLKKEFHDDLNSFVTYAFDTILVVNDIFYVGWIKTKPLKLLVGFDINTESQDNMYYNLGQSWVKTSETGSLMFRPVMGKKLNWPASSEEYPEKSIEIYPNPARDYVYIKWPDNLQAERFNVEIYSLQGSLILRQFQGQSGINVTSIQPGVYILRVGTGQSTSYTTKLIISR